MNKSLLTSTEGMGEVFITINNVKVELEYAMNVVKVYGFIVAFFKLTCMSEFDIQR